MYKEDDMTKSYKKDCMELWDCFARNAAEFLYNMEK